MHHWEVIFPLAPHCPRADKEEEFSPDKTTHILPLQFLANYITVTTKQQKTTSLQKGNREHKQYNQ